MAVAAKVWNGPAALRRFLVPIESLEPFPGNPRRGNVAAVAASLRRFGQVRAIVVDGSRIVAGHHVVLGAREEGWTHVAAIPNEFEDEEEQRAYLLADNRTGELGGYDDELLSAQLDALRSYEGVGYSEDDRAELDARLAALRSPVFPESDEVPALDARSSTSGFFEVPLLLETAEDRKDFARLVKLLEREWDVKGVTAVCVRSVREAAQRA